MSGLDQRLRVLEAGDGGRCRSCGLGPGSRIVYTVSWDAEPGEGGEASVSSPPCSRCGQRRLHVLDWDDIVTDLAGDEGGSVR